jgi:hemoglobin/transferrin/lactoferrin receptor protein
MNHLKGYLMLTKTISRLKPRNSQKQNQVKARKPSPGLSKVVTLATLICGFYGHQAAADQLNPKLGGSGQGTMDTINVLATRGEKSNLETPATVSSISKQDMDRRGVKNIKDLFSEELDVDVKQTIRTGNSVSGATNRKGSSESINIRGLEGNRLNLMIDGIKLPYSFGFGSHSAARGDYLDVDGVNSVQVLRGSSSALYGSDGVAGTVLFKTIEPHDMLNDHDKTSTISVSYFDASQTSKGVLSHAVRSNDWSAVMVGSLALGHETQTQGVNDASGSTRTKANPMDTNNTYVLAKYIKELNGGNELKFTLEDSKKRIDTNNLNAISAAIHSDVGQDHINRTRLSLDHQYHLNGSWADVLDSKFWYQETSAHQAVRQTGTSQSNPYLPSTYNRTRDNKVNNDAHGFSLQASKDISQAGDGELTIAHQIKYGLDVSESRIKQELNRSGDVGTAESYIPKTKQDMLGVYLQDDLSISHLNLIPAIRFDRWSINSSAINKNDQAWSPSLGAIWTQRQAVMPFMNIGKGFRAPAAEEISASFTNQGHGYAYIPNPNLNPERVLAKEVGVKGSVQQFKYAISYFNNSYDDFISQYTFNSRTSPTGIATCGLVQCYQYQNAPKANIQGMDLRLEYRHNPQWLFKAGYVRSSGSETTLAGVNQPINTVQPERIILSADYHQGIWGVATTAKYVGAKKQEDIAGANSDAYASSSYTIINTRGQYKASKQLNLYAGINNLFDKKYIDWANISSSGLTQTGSTAVSDYHTSPGRNFFVSMNYEFL